MVHPDLTLAEVELPVPQQITANPLRVPGNPLVHAGRRTQRLGGRQRAEGKAAADAVTRRLGGPGADRSITVQPHLDGAVRAEGHGVGGRVLGLDLAGCVVPGLEAHQTPLRARERTHRLPGDRAGGL